MCGCGDAHPGINCSDVGCVCHKDSPEPWGVNSKKMVFSIDETADVRNLAETFPDTIYFYASLEA